VGDLVTIASKDLTAAINPFGAELTHLRDSAGRELMTDADPAYWTGHAPLLFPIIGALAGDAYRLGEQRYAMPKHGFARHMMFETVEASAARAVFRLSDTDETRAVYPFSFVLDMAFVVDGPSLTLAAQITNMGTGDMPGSFGFHPAFAWPLPYGRARADHRIDFAKDEPGALKRLDGAGLILPGERASPLDGRTLHLADDLFTDDALIWDPIESDRVRYWAGEGPALDLAFDGTMLGVWTKPGAHYVCIEPWHGIADPVGFDGDIWDKPGIMAFRPGEPRQFAMSITLTV
jgi:galactose mutarotase-like enzyme